MELAKVIERLEELFTQDMSTKSFVISYSEDSRHCDVECLKITTRSPLSIELIFEDPNLFDTKCSNNLEKDFRNYRVKLITIKYAKLFTIFCATIDDIATEQFLHYISIDSFDECRSFVAQHSAFPSTVYFNGYNFTFKGDINNRHVTKINDITKVEMVHTIQFKEIQ